MIMVPDFHDIITCQAFIMPRGLYSTEVAYLLLTQQPLVRIPALSKKIRGKIIDVAEVNQQGWLEEVDSGLKMVIEPI